MGILLVKGGEISRSMPPGHLNALFVSDINPLNQKEWSDALIKANEDHAFIMWNHPGWKPQQPDTCLWWPEHEELYNNKMLHGIEVSCGREWYPIALDWCMEKGLAPLSTSDIHVPIEYKYKYGEGFIRSMTLVFAEDRTIPSVKEALLAGRSVALFGDKLAGSEKYLKELFKNSISIDEKRNVKNNKIEKYEITNHSDFPFKLKINEAYLSLHPRSSTFLYQKILEDTTADIINLLTGSQTCLKISMQELIDN